MAVDLDNAYDGVALSINGNVPANWHSGLYLGDTTVPDSNIDPGSIGPNNPRPTGLQNDPIPEGPALGG